MKFRVQNKNNQKLSLVYIEEDYSFDTEIHDIGFTSIMINDLQLEIDYDGRIIYIWGFCPLVKYEETSEAPIHYESNSLIALLDKPPISGISYRLNEEEWPIFINKEKRLVCIGNPKVHGKKMIEFVPNCAIATLEDQEITAIWLMPKDLPKTITDYGNG